MGKILHIIASPRGEHSKSNRLAQAYIDEKKEASSSLEVDELQLWNADIPEFDGDKTEAKMTFFGQGEMNNSCRTAWDEVIEVTRHFMDADEYVLAVPMWNGSIPYKLKQYIDVITQPGLLFNFDPKEGYSGLLNNKKASVFYTAGVFAPGVDAKFGGDFQSTYLEWWLDLIGIRDIQTVRFQPSLVTADPEAEFRRALEKSRHIANEL